MAKRKTRTVIPGTGNVFADLGLPNAEELGTKLRLCFVINKILAEHKLTQAEVARILGVNQPKISALKSYKLEGFSGQPPAHLPPPPRTRGVHQTPPPPQNHRHRPSPGRRRSVDSGAPLM